MKEETKDLIIQILIRTVKEYANAKPAWFELVHITKNDLNGTKEEILWRPLEEQKKEVPCINATLCAKEALEKVNEIINKEDENNADKDNKKNS